MIFRRRKREHPVRFIGNLMWPSIGWRRATSYLVHRVKRMNGSAHSIAAGLASGMALSFTPFLGFHLVLAALVAWATRGNILVSAIGTSFGNPWTFPLIWVWTHELGSRVTGGGGGNDKLAINADIIFNHPMDLLLPMAIGGVMTGAVTWGAVYLVAKPLVTAYQVRRRPRRRSKVEGRPATTRRLLGETTAGANGISHGAER